jgi:XTP/dITP diphosphohydrolase
MKKLLIATTNPAKNKEYKKYLADLNLEIISLIDLSYQPVKEEGKTFKENAILKAKGYFNQFKIPTLADDGGLMIDYLKGEPGVKSHRWLGYEASDEELVKHALKKLTRVPWEKRNAQIITWAAFYDGKNLILEKENIKGFIVEKMPSRIEKSFPWRAILFLPQFNSFIKI